MQFTAAADVTIHHFGCNAIRPRFRWMMLPEEIQDAPFSVAHFSYGYTLHILNESCLKNIKLILSNNL